MKLKGGIDPETGEPVDFGPDGMQGIVKFESLLKGIPGIER